MLALLRELIISAKNLLSGALSTSLSGILDTIPVSWGLHDFFYDTIEICGFAVPTFLIYFFFLDD